MKNKQRTFEQVVINAKPHRVVITFKPMRNLVFRYREGVYHISAPLRFYAHPDPLLEKLVIAAPRLERHRSAPTPIVGEQIYLFGQLVALSELGLTPPLELARAYPPALNAMLLTYLTSRVRAYEAEMNITLPYRIRVETMSTRFGSCSRKTHTLAFTSSLVHYDQATIDSVIVHELAHSFHFNHGPGFYQTLTEYCPDYHLLHHALIKRRYHND